MARLSDLVAGMSDALRFEERSISLCARYLREAGFIHQKGRGPSAAHMRPTDASNLLLGIMASDSLKEAPRSVGLAREASFLGGEINRSAHALDDLPPYPCLRRDGRACDLGAALDALIDETVRYGGPLNDAGDQMTNFLLEITRPGLFAALTLDDGTTTYTARYSRTHPELENLEGSALHEAARKLRGSRGMETMTQIDADVLWDIADILRGEEPSEGAVVPPPYENGQ